jgi:hypothetical protein
MAEAQKLELRLQELMVKMGADLKQREERRDAAQRGPLKWERDQAAIHGNNRREDQKFQQELELKRQQMYNDLLVAQKKAADDLKQQEVTNSLERERLANERETAHNNLILAMGRAPQGGHTRVIHDPFPCLAKGTLILMADWSEKRVEDVKIGDLVLDHKLKPTIVVGALEKFLNKDSLFGFSPEGPFFFTSTHLMGGPAGDNEGLQLYATSLSRLLDENPLMEFLNVQELSTTKPTAYYAVDAAKKVIIVEEMNFFKDPVPSQPESFVYTIEVESEHGTYFANGVVCRHEVPPLEEWPNSMELLFRILGRPELEFVEGVVYSLDSVRKLGGILGSTKEKMAEVISDFFKEGGAHETESNGNFKQFGDREKVLSKLFSNPFYSTFGVGLYGEAGKMLSLTLDNPASPSQRIDQLMKVLEEESVKHLYELLRLEYSHE